MNASTMTVGEAIEALSKFDRTDRLVGIYPTSHTDLTDGDVQTEPNTGIIYEISKSGCRTVAIKVSDE